MITLGEAYQRACRQLGEAQVEIELLNEQLAAAKAEAAEAGARLAALSPETETT